MASINLQGAAEMDAGQRRLLSRLGALNPQGEKTELTPTGCPLHTHAYIYMSVSKKLKHIQPENCGLHSRGWPLPTIANAESAIVLGRVKLALDSWSPRAGTTGMHSTPAHTSLGMGNLQACLNVGALYMLAPRNLQGILLEDVYILVIFILCALKELYTNITFFSLLPFLLFPQSLRL